MISILKENNIRYRAIDEPIRFRPKTWALVVTTPNEIDMISKSDLSKFLSIDPSVDMNIHILKILAELNDEINQNKITKEGVHNEMLLLLESWINNKNPNN